MTRYALKDDGYPTFKKIVSGRKVIGRVAQIAGGYIGLIGPTQYKATTEDAAFKGVVARHCGYVDYDMMAQNNRAIRAVNNQNRAVAQHAAEELISGNFEPFEKLFGLGKERQ